jgi:hypothetical protein
MPMSLAGCLSVQGIQRYSPLSAVRESTQLTAPRGHRIRPVLLQAVKGCAQFYYAHCESALSVSVCAQQKMCQRTIDNFNECLLERLKRQYPKIQAFIYQFHPQICLYFFLPRHKKVASHSLCCNSPEEKGLKTHQQRHKLHTYICTVSVHTLYNIHNFTEGIRLINKLKQIDECVKLHSWCLEETES